MTINEVSSGSETTSPDNAAPKCVEQEFNRWIAGRYTGLVTEEFRAKLKECWIASAKLGRQEVLAKAWYLPLPAESSDEKDDYEIMDYEENPNHDALCKSCILVDIVRAAPTEDSPNDH